MMIRVFVKKSVVRSGLATLSSLAASMVVVGGFWLGHWMVGLPPSIQMITIGQVIFLSLFTLSASVLPLLVPDKVEEWIERL